MQVEALWGNIFVVVAERGLNQMLRTDVGRSAVLGLADNLVAADAMKCVQIQGIGWGM